jgi:hypothetical protein
VATKKTKTYEVICPYCDKPAELVDSAVIYQGKSYGWAYLCKCVNGWAYVGCHKGTKRPLGKLADRELRYWKQRAHEALDPIWKEGLLSRNDTYSWLARQMRTLVIGQPCHIGHFNVEQCQEVVDLCREPRGIEAFKKARAAKREKAHESKKKSG